MKKVTIMFLIIVIVVGDNSYSCRSNNFYFKK